ncbi:MAG: YtxH domain-containing protein [Deltaproteobacteria bacterium]|nr:YtxH domain-containing protein [Deltaproteobacteria bacterium]
MNMDMHDILEHFPSRNEMMRSLQRHIPHQDHSLEMVGVFGAGLVVGAAVALFFAPRTGRELRDDVREQAGRLTDRVRDTVSTTVDAAAAATP